MAGFTLSWFITPLDCAVMESMASHKQISITSSLQQSLKKILTTPHRYIALPQYRLVFGTYSGTYLAKNYTDTVCKAMQQSPEQTAFYKFWLVFAVNGGLSVFWKDPGLARITKESVAKQLASTANNTAKTAAAPSMKMTYAWWMTRDVVHMMGAAVLPDYVEDKFKLSHKQWQMAQLTFPLFTQLVTTPAHLMGLDYFNHQQSNGQSVKMIDRFTRVRKQYVGAVGVRMIRMWAPWSIGLLINRELRDYLNGDHHE
eukprot:CAMPEP_0197052772 /NCGR_PEP_ID=MMETSP1384-20130603/27188_1 /TAXON_ID=29189 /ORGANISM="Ammonia sp." /LENGTH=256 /DNA_ID=CAMNT_0042485573 /DNA_START=107 /DNA_END=877 /DNA_ORIENTATION=+